MIWHECLSVSVGQLWSLWDTGDFLLESVPIDILALSVYFDQVLIWESRLRFNMGTELVYL